MTLADMDVHPPQGYYRTAGEWIAYHQSRGISMVENFMEFYCDHNSEYRWPKGLDENLPWEFLQKPYRTHHMGFVALIPDGRVWGAKGAVIAPENKLIWDVSMEHSEKTPEQHSVFFQDKLPPATCHAKTLGVLTYTASDSYFHWMLDVLPRIDLLRKSGIAIDKFVLNTSPSLSFQQETLSLLNVPPDKQIEIGWNGHLKAKKLTGKHERIYLSRDDASHRRVTNEDQVMDLLEQFQFKKITTSQFTVAEQIAIFASAKVIISPHGANMTNILFCRAGTKVIELFSPGYVNPIYWVLSNHADLDYFYVIGTGRRSPENVFEFPRGKEDIEVDIDQLSRMIQLSGL